MSKEVPEILIPQAFRGVSPKAVFNDVAAHAVGCAGIYNIDRTSSLRAIDEFSGLDLHDRLVPYARQMRKLEINQINSLLSSMWQDGAQDG